MRFNARCALSQHRRQRKKCVALTCPNLRECLYRSCPRRSNSSDLMRSREDERNVPAPCVGAEDEYINCLFFFEIVRARQNRRQSPSRRLVATSQALCASRSRRSANSLPSSTRGPQTSPARDQGRRIAACATSKKKIVRDDWKSKKNIGRDDAREKKSRMSGRLDSAPEGKKGVVQTPNLLLSSSFTACGFALPPVCFIT